MKYLKEYYNYDNEVAEICRRYNIENWSIRDGLVDVDGNVDLSSKALTKLPLKFGRVSGYFYCGGNNLTTLEGGPKEVGGYFYCGGNNLTTLEGGPKKVGGHFYCGDNKLTTLEGAPREVGGSFVCSYNNLTTLKHFSRVGGGIDLGGNPLPKEIYDNEKYLKKIIEWQDEYDIWRDGKLYLPRFRDLMMDIKEGL